MWQSVGLTLLVIVATIVCALLFMLFGEFTGKKHLGFLTCCTCEQLCGCVAVLATVVNGRCEVIHLLTHNRLL